MNLMQGVIMFAPAVVVGAIGGVWLSRHGDEVPSISRKIGAAVVIVGTLAVLSVWSGFFSPQSFREEGMLFTALFAAACNAIIVSVLAFGIGWLFNRPQFPQG